MKEMTITAFRNWMTVDALRGIEEPAVLLTGDGEKLLVVVPYAQYLFLQKAVLSVTRGLEEDAPPWE